MTDDGAETELDIGHYERLPDENLDASAKRYHRQAYSTVIAKERRGETRETAGLTPHHGRSSSAACAAAPRTMLLDTITRSAARWATSSSSRSSRLPARCARTWGGATRSTCTCP
ncbi:hypothetical protein QJS66_06060 [Kocuria rhizophila]|nr:hypothetical protein QJS66_06060 [Kocuria rhizophila]